MSTRVNPSTLDKILDIGRFRSQVYPGVNPTSQVTSVLPQDRRRIEREVFGLPEKSHADTHPVYGYIGNPDEKRGETFDALHVDQYGDARIVFKDSVRPRTTVVYGDSLANFDAHLVIPAPVDAFDWDAFGKSLKGTRDNPFISSIDSDINWNRTYFDAQIHGGVTLDDIDYVEWDWDRSGRNGRLTQHEEDEALVARLRKAGIKVRKPKRGEAPPPRPPYEVMLEMGAEFPEVVHKLYGSKDVDPEFERQHPRGRGGRFRDKPDIEVFDALAWARSLPLPLVLVGGAVRDELLGRKTKDYDFLAENTSTEELRRVVLASGARIEDLEVGGRVVGIRAYPPGGPEGGIEIAPPRKEVSTGPGRQDFEIVADENVTLEEDARRRDFTVNALYKRLGTAREPTWKKTPTGYVSDDDLVEIRRVAPGKYTVIVGGSDFETALPLSRARTQAVALYRREAKKDEIIDPFAGQTENLQAPTGT